MHDQSEIRRRVEVQGFSGLTADELRVLDRWLRFAPLMNFLVNTLGTILRSPATLLALATLMLLGALLPSHP